MGKGKYNLLTMDLMLSVNTISAIVIFSAIMKMLTSNPVTQALLNTTLVFLENTKEVWKPVVDVAAFVTKPLAPLVLLVLDTAVKAMVVFGYMTVTTVRKVASYANMTLIFIKESGMSVGTAITNAVDNVKDVVVSLGTLSKALASLTVRMIKAASYVVNSFEQVSDFFYRSLFETSSVTYQDMVDVALPFVLVSCIMGLLAWRFSRLFVSTSKPNPIILEEPCKPRRSARLAEQLSRLNRKRAMMSCTDSTFSG